MDKKKIEDFGTFCTLIANEPENVYKDKSHDNTEVYIPTSLGREDSINNLNTNFNIKTYYHIPAKKKKTMAQYYDSVGCTFTLDVDLVNKLRYNKIPNSEFEVDE